MSRRNSSIPAGSRPIERVPGYRVCNDSTVWSSLGRHGAVVAWHVLRQQRNKRGYMVIYIRINDLKKALYIHHIVLEAFIGPCPEGMEARHFPDRDRTNNRVENLSWATHAVNEADKRIHGTLLTGDKAPWSILKEADIPEIFRLFRLGVIRSEIARIYGVSRWTISSVLDRKNWSHVPVPAEYLPTPR